MDDIKLARGGRGGERLRVRSTKAGNSRHDKFLAFQLVSIAFKESIEVFLEVRRGVRASNDCELFLRVSPYG